MMTFKAFINEKNNPNWLRVSIGMITLRVRKLTTQIENETDPIKQNTLIAQQNKLIAYINGLGVAVSNKDKKLMTRMRKGVKD